MKIHDISIRNFRGIDELNNLKCGGLTTIVGKNDSGKSIILSALNSFFNEKMGLEDVFLGIEEDDIVSIKVRFNPPEQVHPLALDAEGKICIEKEFSPDKSKKIKPKEYYICNDIDSDSLNNCFGVNESGLNDRLAELSEEFSRSGRGVTNISKIEQIDQACRSHLKSEQRHPIGEYWRNIRRAYPGIVLPGFSSFEAEADLDVSSTNFQNQFKELTISAINDDLNKEARENIESNVEKRLDEEFEVITALMKKNVPGLEAIKPRAKCNWNNLAKFDINLKFADEKYDVPIENKGTGFRRLLMVAYFEYLATKSENTHQIYAIEEPETYLHPSLQVDLLNSLLTISESAQVFITTHSPIFAGATQTSNIIVVSKENSISQYFTSTDEGEILPKIVSELGIKPNYNLVTADYQKVVFVEGANDVRFWQLAIEKISGYNFEDVLFIPCGGHQVEFFVNAEICHKINKQFVMILDSDKGALDYETKSQNQSALKQKVESLGGKFCLLHKREIENYYHKAALQRKLGDEYALPDEFLIDEFCDVQKLIKDQILPNITRNFKVKNDIELFRSMTSEEWREVGVKNEVLYGDLTDLEHIVNVIFTR